MDEIIAQTVPLPLEPSQLAHVPYWPELMTLVIALSQAWPLVRGEIHDLEERCARLGDANARLLSERGRTVESTNDERSRREEESQQDARKIQALNQQLDATRAALAAASAEAQTIPERTRLAEHVCRSINPHHQGSGGTWVWIDGAAWDAWKAAVA